MISQKVLLASAVLVSSGSVLVGVPLIGLHLNGDQLAEATFSLMFNALIGVFDVLRPMVTRLIASNQQAPSTAWLLKSAVMLGLVFGLVGWFGFCMLDVPFLDQLSVIFLSLTIFFFCIVSALWGVLDAQGEVGVAQLYRAGATASFIFGVAALGVIEVNFSPSLLLLASVAMLSIVFLVRVHAKFYLGRSSANKMRVSELFFLFFQNLAKLPIDFLDRIVAARFLPVGSYALYSLTYEYISKVSIVPQLISSYSFPKLCTKEVSAESFLSTGLLFSAFLTLVGWLGFVYIDPSYLVVLGIAEENFWLVPAFMAVFASHSLSFFSQAIGRSLGLQRELACSYWCSAILGILFLVVMLSMDINSLETFAISVVILKSSYLFFIPFLVGRVASGVLVRSLVVCLTSLISAASMILSSGA